MNKKEWIDPSISMLGVENTKDNGLRDLWCTNCQTVVTCPHVCEPPQS